jgi:ribose 5-phosphate isomerase B
MKLVIAGDSAGAPLVTAIELHIRTQAQHEIVNLSEVGFYADIAAHVAKEIIAGNFDRGILCCGTGIGVCISANKVPGIRAAQTHDTYSAERAAKSNNAQIITMGARVIGVELAKMITDTWLSSNFDPNSASAANVDAINRLDNWKQYA